MHLRRAEQQRLYLCKIGLIRGYCQEFGGGSGIAIQLKNAQDVTILRVITIVIGDMAIIGCNRRRHMREPNCLYRIARAGADAMGNKDSVTR